MNPADPSQLVGSVVAERYRVQDCVGSGTMGAVYRAEHIHMKKTVALKVLHPSHTRDPEVVERFQREARAAGNLNHPNIAAAYDLGQASDGTLYIVDQWDTDTRSGGGDVSGAEVAVGCRTCRWPRSRRYFTRCWRLRCRASVGGRCA